MSAIKTAIERAGGMRALARAMDVHYQSIQSWVKTRVPAERIVDIERVTGVPREELRPDLYRREPPKSGRSPKPV
jgi:DNA-binding transcriptional regulator YdaS (Cro superfamily)